ncbi:MAG: ABC transporter ATP-binding protein [Firmicutes bacterium]|nr:ABC transporter ATP-binding protein [Bacillota bacterium]
MLKRFVSYYRYAWKLFVLDMVCASMIAVLDLVFPIMTRVFMKDFIPNRQLRLIVIYIAALVLMYVVRLGLQYVVDYWGHVVGVRMEYQMRKDLFSHLQTLDFNFFDNTRVGYLMSRMVNDLRDVVELAHHGPEDLLIASLMLIGSFAYLMSINVQLTLIAFLFIPFIAWFAISRRTKMRAAFRREREKVAEVNADLENSLSGIRVAKSYTNEDYEIDRFDAANLDFKEAREGAYKHMAEYTAGLNFLTNLLNLAVLGAGGIYTYYGIIDLADLTAYLMFISFFLQPIRRLTAFTQQYQQGMSGFARFVELMDTQPEIVDSPNAAVLENVKGHIELRDVSFKYHEKAPVLHNVDLTIEPGTTVALVGPSGGGKTTLCHLLPRFYDVSAGAIYVDGRDVRDIQLHSLRENIGLVSQDVFLFTGTIKDNILYGDPAASDMAVMEAAKSAGIHDFIMSLPDQYDTYVGERGVKLSGGQKQRISIARVFLKNPPILILDEATSSLDNVTEALIQESLDKLSVGRTTLVIAHRLSTIKGADEIVVLDQGRIVERGSHEELLKANGAYAELYRSQFVGEDDAVVA